MYNLGNAYNIGSTAEELPQDGEDFDATFFDPEGEADKKTIIEIPKDLDGYKEILNRLKLPAGSGLEPGAKTAEVGEKAESAEPVESAAEAGRVVLEAMRETRQPEGEPAVDAVKVGQVDQEIADPEEEATESEEEPKLTTVSDVVSFNNAHYEKVKQARTKMQEEGQNNQFGFDDNLREKLAAAEAELEKKNRTITELKGKLARKDARKGFLNVAAGWLSSRREKRETKRAERAKEAEIQEAIRTDETLQSLYDTYAKGWERYNGAWQSKMEQAQWLTTLASLKETILMEEGKIAFEKRHLEGKTLDYKDAVMGFAKQMLVDGGVYTIIQKELDQKEKGWDEGLGEAEKQVKMYEYEEEQYRKAAEIPDPEMMELIQGRLRNMFFASMRGQLMYNDAQKYNQADAKVTKDV